MRVILLMVLFVVPAWLPAAPQISGGQDELTTFLLDSRKIVSLSGEAKLNVAADKALVRLRVQTENEEFKKALAQNRSIRQAIREELVAKGIKSSEIKFDRFVSTPEYGWFGDKPKSYTISNKVKITITSEAELESIAAIVDKKPQVYYYRTEFEHSAKAETKQKVLEQALSRVNSKKLTYEKSLGIKLKVVRVAEDNVTVTQPQPVFRDWKPDVKSFAFRSSAEQESFAAAAQDGSFGEIVYKAETRVEYIVDN